MAQRPFFFSKSSYIRQADVDFTWYSGFAVSQKQKSIASMHGAIKREGYVPLEVSTKSQNELGRRLSAFNLKLDGYYLENIFQSSKVFEAGGPYTDLLKVEPKTAKRDERLRSSGSLVCFRYKGEDWPLLPRTAFYDYVYYCAVRETLSEDDLKELKKYTAFTDIEFNPNKSLNTQARSIAIVRLILEQCGKLPEMSREEFLKFQKACVRG